MPNPYTVPIVGSSFDSVGSQLFGWSQANNQVESANISRRNDAERNKNNYFARIAELARADAAADLQQKAYQFGIARENEQEGRRRFEFGQRRDDAMAESKRGWDFNNKKFAADETEYKRQMEIPENAAETMKRQVFETGRAMDAAIERASQAQQNARIVRDIELKKLPPGSAALKGGRIGVDTAFQKAARGTDEAAKLAAQAIESINSANERISLAESEAVTADSQRKELLRSFNDISNRAGRYSLEPVKLDGKWSLVNPQTKKTFSFTPETVTHYPKFSSFEEARAGGYSTGNTITTADGSNAVIPPMAAPAVAPSASYNFGGAAPQPAIGGMKVLDAATAKAFLLQARMDKNIARQLAREAGYSIP